MNSVHACINNYAYYLPSENYLESYTKWLFVYLGDLVEGRMLIVASHSEFLKSLVVSI